MAHQLLNAGLTPAPPTQDPGYKAQLVLSLQSLLTGFTCTRDSNIICWVSIWFR